MTFINRGIVHFLFILFYFKVQRDYLFEKAPPELHFSGSFCKKLFGFI